MDIRPVLNRDFQADCGRKEGSTAQALGLVLQELRRLAASAPSAAELRRARDYVIGQIDLGLESTEHQMNWIGEQLLGYGKILAPSATKRRLQAISPGEIRAVAGDFFRSDRLNLALVSPLESEKHLAKLLRL